MEIKVKKKDSTVILPEYKTDGASGFDLRAHFVSYNDLDESNDMIIVKQNSIEIIPTGLYFEIPYMFELQVRSRSGLAIDKKVFVLNSPGTIDSDYRGEVKIILYNLGNAFPIKQGDRIAQGVISPIYKANFKEVKELVETKRNKKGFGSTGI